MSVDYLIVGQGIAGTVFCEHALQAGMSVRVIDDPLMSNSSKVAAGLYNPITGRRMVKTWNCDNLFSYLTPFYRALEKKLGERFLVEMPVYRPFISNEELNEWMGKSAESAFEPYVDEVKGQSCFGDHVHDSFGGVLLKKCGYLDTKSLINAYRGYLIDAGIFVHDRFDFSSLDIHESGITYKEITAKKIIFCEGKLLRDNPFFNCLPIRPVKGELLFIKTQSKIDVVYNRGVFVIPLGNGLCKVGATYDKKNLDESVTLEARNELISRLDQLIRFEYEIIEQKAGVRPATIDRKPFLGMHPEFSQLVIFNGMGAKGVSLTPFYAKQLVAHLTQGDELDTEVNIERFFSLF